MFNTRLIKRSLPLVAVLLLVLPGLLQAKEAPKFKVYTHIVKAPFVKKAVDGQTPGVVIDSRPVKKKYDLGHIPGSLSMPFSQFDKLTSLLPKNKGALIIFYCQGPT